MSEHRLSHPLPSPVATAQLAIAIGATLLPGDCILLSGEIGSGKTHFARSLIQSLLVRPEDVPSPTFTLVQVYDTTRGEIWHTDLYRITGPGEIEELGLAEAFADAITLVEWPDKLGTSAPPGALGIEFGLVPGRDNARLATFSWSVPRWSRIPEIAS